MTDANEWNRRIIDEFRANDGKVGGNFEGAHLLLLHHFGAKSGLERVNPVAFQRVGDGYAVFASNGGAPTNPDWFHNVVANPHVSIEVGSERHDVTARVATGEEREEIWDAQKAAYPNFAEYEKTTGGRQIPILVLDPA
jgi:deazaflavin-dependent oxidoreductase (nitroreductase family)